MRRRMEETPCFTLTLSAVLLTLINATSVIPLIYRLAKHNKGDVPHTSKFKPWKIEVYIAFETAEKAVDFEAYLKSVSGHAFAKRHF